MRGGLGKTLLTAFLLLAIVPLGLLAFATYNQIQNDTRHKVLTSLDTIVALEEAHVVDWVEGCERELGLLAGVCGGDPAAGEACAAHAAAWLTETQAAGVGAGRDRHRGGPGYRRGPRGARRRIAGDPLRGRTAGWYHGRRAGHSCRLLTQGTGRCWRSVMCCREVSGTWWRCFPGSRYSA